MGRDKDLDPRLQARKLLDMGEHSEAKVWALIHQGDAIHRLAKALEAPQTHHKPVPLRAVDDGPEAA